MMMSCFIQPQTSMDIMQYSLINWEQVKGESPEFTSELSSNRGIYMIVHVLLCLVCLFDLACFFLSSFSSLI